jgi:hypothetical protein
MNTKTGITIMMNKLNHDKRNRFIKLDNDWNYKIIQELCDDFSFYIQ